MELNEIFSKIFEWLGYQTGFYSAASQENLFSYIGLISIITSFVLVISFYFIINRPSFSRWNHWLYVLLINFLIAFLIGFLIPQNTFNLLGLQYEAFEYIIFGLKNALISTVLFIFWTYCFKWWKGHAKGTPKLFFGKF